MKVLITGGGGFLGSHLGDRLLAAGHEVTGLDTAPDLKVRHNIDNPKFRYIKGSIFDQDLMEKVRDGMIDRDQAVSYAVSPHDFKLRLAGAVSSAANAAYAQIQ